MKKQAKENFEITISKEELNALPTEKFAGEIIVVNSEDDAERIVEELENAPIVGFDTETRPSFQKGQNNKVALLQLSTESKSFLIRLCNIGLPSRIKAFLEDESKLKVGLSIKDDFHSLTRLGPFKPAGFLDLQEYVKNFRIAECSLTKVHAIVFGRRISKSQQLTNWEAQALTNKQQEYAALDALACVNIYKKLKSGEFHPEDSPYYKEICREKE